MTANRFSVPSIFFAFALVVGCSAGAVDGTAVGKDNLGGSTPNSSGGSGGSVAGPSSTTTAGGCPANPAAAVLDNAICVCKDFALAGALETRATLGGNANVGTNGRFSAATGTTKVAGDLVAEKGVQAAGQMSIRDNLGTPAGIEGAGDLRVGNDLTCGGNITMAGSLEVDGALRLGGQLLFAGNPTIASRAAFQPVAEPCGCDGSKFFDVGARVDAAKAQNDNAKAGLDSSVLKVGPSSLSLTTGNYYFTSITTVGSGKIHIDGAVAIHIDGDLTQVGKDTFELGAGATLDLFVKGSMQSAGDLSLGEGAQAGAFRLYVGGRGVLHADDQAFHGLLYAPRATVAFAGNTVVYGAVFADQLVYAGSLVVDYRAPTAPSSTACPPDADAGPGSGAGNDAGTGGGSSADAGSPATPPPPDGNPAPPK